MNIMKIKSWVEAYVESKKNSWTPVTSSTELKRLNALAPHIDGDPETLLRGIKNLGKYTQATAFTRVTCFWDYLVTKGLVSKGTNPYRKFRGENHRLFKNAYERKPSRYTFETCLELIGQITNEAIRNKALELLYSGCRYTESYTIRDGKILGKGEKPRPYLGPHIPAPKFNGSYSYFERCLNVVGLKSHDLRKAFATLLVKEGANPYDLCRIMGWSNVNTALSYIQTKDDTELKAFVGKATNAKRTILKSVSKNTRNVA